MLCLELKITPLWRIVLNIACFLVDLKADTKRLQVHTIVGGMLVIILIGNKCYSWMLLLLPIVLCVKNVSLWNFQVLLWRVVVWVLLEWAEQYSYCCSIAKKLATLQKQVSIDPFSLFSISLVPLLSSIFIFELFSTLIFVYVFSSGSRWFQGECWRRLTLAVLMA